MFGTIEQQVKGQKLYSDICFEYFSAFWTAYVVLTFFALNPQLCFTVFAFNVAVSFDISYLVFLSYEKSSHAVGYSYEKHIFSLSLVDVP